MKTADLPGRDTFRRRWLLSLLATRPGRRLLNTSLIAALALNLGGPAWAAGHSDKGTWRRGEQLTPALAGDNWQLTIDNSQSPSRQAGTNLQSPKAKTQDPYSN